MPTFDLKPNVTHLFIPSKQIQIENYPHINQLFLKFKSELAEERPEIKGKVHNADESFLLNLNKSVYEHGI